MTKLGCGYGSEFHLLRMLGRHRNLFEKEILKVLNYPNGKFCGFDFNFDEENSIPDKELIGIEFLENEPNFEILKQSGKKYWPKTGSSQNWDAVCKINDEYILLETKAHEKEMYSKTGAGSDSKVFIQEQFESIRQEYNIKTENDWTEKYYQKANRILFLKYLLDNNIKSKLLFVYFINGYKIDERINIDNKDEWEKLIEQQDNYLGISDNLLLKDKIFNLIIPADKKST